MSRLVELRELTRVRIVLFLREPEAIFWVFVFPIVLAAVLGFAFRNTGVEPSRVGVVRAVGDEALVAALEAYEHLEVVLYEDHITADKKLARGAVDGLIEDDEPPRLTFDPKRGEAETARLRVLEALALAEDPDRVPSLAVSEVSETGSRYVDFLFPGLLGMNLMGTGMWGIGFGIADIRRRKLMKRLLVTPMRRSSFFLSFMLSRLVFLIVEVVALVLVGTLLLGVPFRGGLLPFTVVSILGGFTFAGLGILAASRARTIEAVSGIINFIMMPMWLCSGVFFSYERFPDFLHPLLRALPLTALNDSLRALMLDGEGLGTVASELLVQVLWCVLTFALALRIFRWE